MKTSLSHLKDKWPSSIVARRRVKEFTGGLISEKYMANLDSQGQGPARVRIGRQVAYPVDGFVLWLENRTNKIEKGGERQRPFKKRTE